MADEPDREVFDLRKQVNHLVEEQNKLLAELKMTRTQFEKERALTQAYRQVIKDLSVDI